MRAFTVGKLGRVFVDWFRKEPLFFFGTILQFYPTLPEKRTVRKKMPPSTLFKVTIQKRQENPVRQTKIIASPSSNVASSASTPKVKDRPRTAPAARSKLPLVTKVIGPSPINVQRRQRPSSSPANSRTWQSSQQIDLNETIRRNELHFTLNGTKKVKTSTNVSRRVKLADRRMFHPSKTHMAAVEVSED